MYVSERKGERRSERGGGDGGGGSAKLSVKNLDM